MRGESQVDTEDTFKAGNENGRRRQKEEGHQE